MKFVRKIDEQGFFIGDDFVEEINELTIETPIPNGMYVVSGVTPKWDSEEGVEVIPKPEITIVSEPTAEERLKSLEDAMLFMMMGGI